MLRAVREPRAVRWSTLSALLASVASLCVVSTTACREPAPVPNICLPPSPTLHRLNRREYDRTVIDLLGVATPAAAFPPDDVAGGFDNNADVLSMSPLLLEKLDDAAQDIAAVAFPVDGPHPCPDVSVDDCAAQTVLPLLARAFRRPLEDGEAAPYLALVKGAVDEGAGFAVGLQRATWAMLVSPSFLFRAEFDVDDQLHALSPYELASRLSYFLWATMPDAALFARAADGSLLEPAVLRAEVERLLLDEKADGGIVDALAGQWLNTRALDRAAPDPIQFPLDDQLRTAMKQETKLVVRELLASDRSARDLIDLEFSYVNQDLADLYGLDYDAALALEGDDDGDGYVRVSLAGSDRVGVLTHAAFLTATSQTFRTSPVKRGYFVVDTLLCIPPPAPPPDIPEFPDDPSGGSVRERMAAHRASPACAGCHTAMDPIGFGLERFDPLGRVRTSDVDGYVIDDDDAVFGTAFTNPHELAAALKDQPGLGPCMVEKLGSYTLGVSLEGRENACTVDGIHDDAEQQGFSLRAILTAVVDSDAFQMRRARVGPDGGG